MQNAVASLPTVKSLHERARPELACHARVCICACRIIGLSLPRVHAPRPVTDVARCTPRANSCASVQALAVRLPTGASHVAEPSACRVRESRLIAQSALPRRRRLGRAFAAAEREPRAPGGRRLRLRAAAAAAAAAGECRWRLPARPVLLEAVVFDGARHSRADAVQENAAQEHGDKPVARAPRVPHRVELAHGIVDRVGCGAAQSRRGDRRGGSRSTAGPLQCLGWELVLRRRQCVLCSRC